jgi:hypothetical protein
VAVTEIVVVRRHAVSSAQFRGQRNGDGLHGKHSLFLVCPSVCLTRGGDIQARKVELVVGRIAAEQVIDAAIFLVDHDHMIDGVGIGNLSTGDRYCKSDHDERAEFDR